MTSADDNTPNYKDTLHLPKTGFPMKAGLPRKEPEILARWQAMDLYGRQREAAKGKEKFILHDGPPYANGHIHIGHALNKILKDIIPRSRQMMGFDANYVPGWDCHGLPIEWKIEEQYRARGKDKDQVPVNEFRQECREFADKWIAVQNEEFQRLGVIGDWKTPYTTMAFKAEAQIARELMKFATSGQLYRGSKPVMWSVVEKTALAEAEVEYHDYESDTIWVKFPISPLFRFNPKSSKVLTEVEGKNPSIDAQLNDRDELQDVSLVIWTTTPWTIPGNRAISYSPKIGYGLYEITAAENEFGPQPGEKLIFADKLAEECFAKAKLEFRKLRDVSVDELEAITCAHPLKGLGGGYEFPIPLLAGDHVTDDAGTGFVHTAPGHGREDFDIWMAKGKDLNERGISTNIPFTVDDDGFFTADAPGFGPDREGGPARVLTDKGKKGDANQAVISALIEQGALFARGRLKHEYPHSWRSKKPVIFRNTPQWFISMGDGEGDKGLRQIALKAIDETAFFPPSGQNRLRAMITDRPDWIISRQRAWGVPITVFYNPDTNEVLQDEAVNARIADIFEAEGADAWFADGAKERFLGNDHDPDKWVQVSDILDVWFDSGSTHAYVLEQRDDLKTPASLYLEGSDQHRGWFHSSLLESCGTRGRAPYEQVLTHGFILDEKGEEKMSKSQGNTLSPADVMKQSGADILRLWVASSDYMNDIRFGPDIVKSNAESYRRLRNTLRFLLGNLDSWSDDERVPYADLPELEQWILHRLHALDAQVRDGYTRYEFMRVFNALFNFCTGDLSAFYFDIRKDALYCDPIDGHRRRSVRTVLDHLFNHLVTWFAPILAFTMEEVWQTRYPSEDGSVHLQLFSDVPGEWNNNELNDKWNKIREVRKIVTGALEVERQEKRIGSSLESAPVLYVSDPDLLALLQEVDMAELCITSNFALSADAAPADAFRSAEFEGLAVDPGSAVGEKCLRCWMILPDVGDHAETPGACNRCASAINS